MRQLAEESSKNRKEIDEKESKYNEQEMEIIEKENYIEDLYTKCNI